MKRDDDMGSADWREIKERIGEATKGKGLVGGLFGLLIESRRISRETNMYMHPTDYERRKYYDRKKKSDKRDKVLWQFTLDCLRVQHLI